MSVKQDPKPAPMFRCDRCKIEKPGERGLPSDGCAQPWAELRWNQDAGFDYSGAAWCPRYRDPIHLCYLCSEAVAVVLNRGVPAAPSQDGER